MTTRRVAVNERGQVVGQDHWRAKLTDHEVELIRILLAERSALVACLKTDGATVGDIALRLKQEGMSYRALASKFDVSKSYIRWVALDMRRVQTVLRTHSLPDHRIHINR